MHEPLVDAVRSHQAILFVGAGVSQHLGLPSWRELIGHMAAELGYDPMIFEAHAEGHDGYLELAEYYEIEKRAIGPLRSWIDRTWHTNVTRVDKSKVHQAIVNLKCPTIYTTNYDRWLEIAYKRRGEAYIKIANVGDFIKIRDGSTQIVKLHGDLEDDQSLVLTESSYFKRLAFESPLDIKLRSDSIGKSILFIGYSLSDINIRYLLYKLHQLWAESEFATARPKSYIFLTRPNPVQEAILDQRGITPIVSEEDGSGAGLIKFLEELVLEAFGTTA
jgi:hypothetical protein